MTDNENRKDTISNSQGSDRVPSPPRIRHATPPRPAASNEPFDFRAAVAHAMAGPNRARGVSWDLVLPEGTVLPSRSPARHAGSPNRTTAPGTPPRPIPGGTSPARASSQGTPPRLMMPKLMPKSGDLASQVDMAKTERSSDSLRVDAEEAVLKSLDERDPMVDGKKIGEHILAGVPMEHLNHGFEEETPQDETGSKITSNENSPTRARAVSKDQKASVRSTEGPTHRRQMTVEETIFGLTSALMNVQSGDQVYGGAEVQGIPPPSNVTTGTAADKLANAAELMLHDGESTGTGRDSSRQLLRRTLPRLRARRALAEAAKKEADENPDNAVTSDIEAGAVANDPTSNPNQENDDSNRGSSSGRKGHSPFKHLPYADKIKKEWELFNNFVRPRKSTFSTYIRYIVLYLWIPALSISAILFHFFENPPTGRGPFEVASVNDEDPDAPVEKLVNKPSVSWWLIFICIRQVFILILARGVEAIVVDFLALHTRAILRTCGPVVTLLFVQAKGWPFLMSMWGILNFILVTGNSDFNHHWLYWQTWWGLFNDRNPSGDVTNTLWFRRICAIASSLGAAVAFKRVFIGVYQGRQTFSNYSDKLAQVMNKMLQLSQVAILARSIEGRYFGAQQEAIQDRNIDQSHSFSDENLLSLIELAHVEETGEEASTIGFTERSRRTMEDTQKVIDADDIDPFTGGLGESQKARIADLLGRWEEPGRLPTQSETVSIGAVLQFRRALASMETSFPFSGAFGLADTRENCVASAQAVYDRLMLASRSPTGRLHFDIIAALALKKDGDLDSERVKELIRTFRPERDGTISMVDFVRSIDAVYRELRMLRATIAASSKIDRALAKIFNVVFYVVSFCIILSVTGFDPFALFLSLSSIILAFAFMIGSASAKYFEGLLFILLQRPYGIGDRINVSNAQSPTSGDGAQGWIVDDVNLFTTTIYMAGTNEKATISNGTLASSRIINGARSPKAVICLFVKFGLDAEYTMTEAFKDGVEAFVKSRPREWLSLIAIRASKVEVDLGYIEYCVALQHREAWQNVGPILDSKSTISRFMLELMKKLNIRYKAPPVPIVVNEEGSAKTANLIGSATTAGDSSESSPSPPQEVDTIKRNVQDVLALFSKKATPLDLATA